MKGATPCLIHPAVISSRLRWPWRRTRRRRPDAQLARLGAQPGQDLSFGLVTYLWGKDWDVPTLIRNCTTAKLLGVELRTGHAHKVEPSLTAAQRAEVKKQFADSPVTLVGIGSAEEFHHPDPRGSRRPLRRRRHISSSATTWGPAA